MSYDRNQLGCRLEEQIVWIRKLWDVVGGLPMRTPRLKVRLFRLSLNELAFYLARANSNNPSILKLDLNLAYQHVVYWDK
jgi:hypothetical protein